MKNILSRLFKQSILAIGVFAIAIPAIAATFNNDPLDLATIRVMNVTRSGIVNTAWSQSTTANPNEIVSFAIYYHNTAPDAAGNTRVSLLVPTNVGTQFTVPGSVRADNAQTVSGSAIVSLSSSQSLTFIPGSVIWRPDNCTSCNRPLPFGQNGSELLTAAGLNLGSIGPDSSPRSFSSQGSVVVDFIVSNNNQTPPPAQNITPTVQTNAVSNLTCTDVTLNGFINTNGNASFDAFFEIANNSGMVGASQTSTQNFSNTSGNFSRSVSVSQNSTQFYRMVARATNGALTQGAVQSFSVPSCNQISQSNPVVTTNPATNVGNTDATLNGFLNANGNQVVTAYFEYGVNCSFPNRSNTQTFGNVSTSFAQTVTNLSPNTTYCYRAVGQLPSGSQFFGNTQTFTTGSQQLSTAFVQTNPATGVGSNSATLNGFVSMSNNFPQNTSVFFEYGPSVFLGNTTALSNLGFISSSNFARFVSGLSPNTTYFYRAAAQLSNGTIIRGNILTFTTTSGFIPTFTPSAPSGPTGFANVAISKEAANLTFPNGTFECLAGRIGDTIEYRITVRNNARTTQATNLTVRDVVPANTSFVSVSNGGSVNGNEISWNIGTLAGGESRTLSFQVRVNPVPSNSVSVNTARVTNGVSTRNSNSVDLIILTSTAPAGPQIVTGANGQQFIIGPDGQPQPYNGSQVTVNSVDKENAAEEVADAVSTFFPETALGWLGLLILVAVIALIIRAIV